MPITTTVSRNDVRESQTVTSQLRSVPGPDIDPLPPPPVLTRFVKEVAGGTRLVARLQALPAGAQSTYFVDVVCVVDAEHVFCKGVSPSPTSERSDPRTIELRWRVRVAQQGEAFGFEVTLGCKRGASGTTCFAWTFASDAPTTAPDEWAAWIGSYHHDPRHHCE